MSLELIQIIEADQEQAAALDHVLRKAHFRTNTAFDGATGIQDIWKNRPSVVVVDLMVPGIEGKTLCKQLRDDPQTKSIGIIVMTALSSENYRVAALEHGADDVLTKPYSAREMVARIQAVLRRLRTGVQDVVDDLDEDLVLDQVQYVATFRGRQVALSSAEWKVLYRLAKSPDKVVPLEELRTIVWGNDGLEHLSELDRLVQALSQKLGPEDDNGRVIMKAQGSGYRLLRKGQELRLAA